jgi:hypothetical protein
MARQLDTEKRFLVLTDVPSHPILAAYQLMQADIRPFDASYELIHYGTMIAFSTSDETWSELSKTPLRFFGILMTPEGYTIKQKKDYDPFARLENGYIGVPTHHLIISPEGFWSVTYPHITMVPPTHKLHSFADKIAPVEYFYSELMETKNTYVYHVLMDTPHHITMAVRHGKKPVIAGTEVVPGNHYTECSGHAVIM